jgi:hypothetical protein
MKRASARLIILLLTIAAVLWRYTVITEMWWTCNLIRMMRGGYCTRARHMFTVEVGIIILIAAAAWVWARQLPES